MCSTGLTVKQVLTSGCEPTGIRTPNLLAASHHHERCAHQRRRSSHASGTAEVDCCDERRAARPSESGSILLLDHACVGEVDGGIVAGGRAEDARAIAHTRFRCSWV